MKVLQLVFSPRAGGNCEGLARRAAEFLAASGRAEVETLLLRDLDIRPCRRCAYECMKPPAGSACAEDDEVPRIWRKVWDAHAIIWYIPTFGGSPPDDELAAKVNAAVVIANPVGATSGEETARLVEKELRAGPGRLLRCEVLSPKALGSSNSISDLIKDNPEPVRRVEALADELVGQAACFCRRR